MELILSVATFVSDNLNLIMIMLGVITIATMLLILAFNSKSSQRLERDRLKKLQQDKLLAQEMEEQFANAINLSEQDVVEEEKLSKEEKLLKEIKRNKSADAEEESVLANEGIVEDFDFVVKDIKEEQKQKEENDAENVELEKEVAQTNDVSESAEAVKEDEPKEKQKVTSKKKKAEKDKEKEEKVEEPAEELVEKNKKAEKEAEEDKSVAVEEPVTEDAQSDVLDNYESVIKESDAMLEAMQNIIDTNIEEMQKLEEEPLVVNNSKNVSNATSLVSKYKVLYDKTKKEWVVKKEGATRATKRCKTKDEAIEFAKKCTIDAEIGNTFHQKDGKFQKRAKK